MIIVISARSVWSEATSSHTTKKRYSVEMAHLIPNSFSKDSSTRSSYFSGSTSAVVERDNSPLGLSIGTEFTGRRYSLESLAFCFCCLSSSEKRAIRISRTGTTQRPYWSTSSEFTIDWTQRTGFSAGLYMNLSTESPIESVYLRESSSAI